MLAFTIIERMLFKLGRDRIHTKVLMLQFAGFSKALNLFSATQHLGQTAGSDRCRRCSAMVDTGTPVLTNGVRHPMVVAHCLLSANPAGAPLFELPRQVSPALLHCGLAGYYNAPEKILVTVGR